MVFAVSFFHTIDQMVDVIKRAHSNSDHGLTVDVIKLWTQYDFKAWLAPYLPKERTFLITTARAFKFIKACMCMCTIPGSKHTDNTGVDVL